MRRFTRHLRPSLSLDEELAARQRPTSFPFISGDTFRAMSDVIVDETGLSGALRPEGRIFCAAKYTDDLLRLCDSIPDIDLLKTINLMIHNGDVLPGESRFRELLQRFRSVFSVNSTVRFEEIGVKPVPIGLENLHWQRNGLLHYFDLPSNREDQLSVEERPIDFLGSFRTSSNPAARLALRAEILERGGEWFEPSADLDAYFRKVRNSVFVFSPEGNGPDCHRTWESVYLGAIPVVLERSLSCTLTDFLPILVVKEWADFFSLGDGDRQQLAREIRSRSTERAFLPFWARQF